MQITHFQLFFSKIIKKVLSSEVAFLIRKSVFSVAPISKNLEISLFFLGQSSPRFFRSVACTPAPKCKSEEKKQRIADGATDDVIGVYAPPNLNLVRY